MSIYLSIYTRLASPYIHKYTYVGMMLRKCQDMYNNNNKKKNELNKDVKGTYSRIKHYSYSHCHPCTHTCFLHLLLSSFTCLVHQCPRRRVQLHHHAIVLVHILAIVVFGPMYSKTANWCGLGLGGIGEWGHEAEWNETNWGWRFNLEGVKGAIYYFLLVHYC